MPIVFAQPDAISTAAGQAAAIGGGQVEQANKDRAFYAQMLGIASQSQGHAAQMAAANAQTGAAWSQAGEQQAAGGQRADEIAQQQINQQGAQAAQMAQAEQMQAQQFSYQDSVRLAQQQQAWASVDSDPTLSPEEKQQLKSNIAPGMNKLQAQMQQAQLKQKQQQLADDKDAASLQAAHTKTIGQFLTDSPDGIKVNPDGSKLVFDGTKLHYEPPPKAATEAKGPDQTKLDEQWRDNYLKVEKHLTTKDPVSLAEVQPSPDQVQQKMKALGHGSTLEEDRQMRGAPARQPTATPPGQAPQTPPTAPAPTGQDRVAIEAEKADIMKTPLNELTPAQIKRIRDINTTLGQANINQTPPAPLPDVIPRKRDEEATTGQENEAPYKKMLRDLREINQYNPLTKMGFPAPLQGL